MKAIVEIPQGSMLSVRVVPNASRSEVAQVGPDIVRIRLKAPAVEGKANKALVEFLVDALGIRARQIDIVGGGHARQKRVLVIGLTSAEISRRLGSG